jgi:hypothetical protein
VLLLSIAKWRDLLKSQLLVYNGDRRAPQDILNLLPEGTDSDPGRWLTRHMMSIWHSYVEKPAHHQAEDLVDPKDTSTGICMYVSDPTDFEYWCILSQGTLCM